MNLDSQIQQISTDELDKIFDATPEGTGGIKNLVGGEEGENQIAGTTGQLDNINIDDVPNPDDEYKEPAPKKKVKLKAPEAEGTEEETEEEEVVEGEDGKEPEEEIEEEETEVPETAEVQKVLKSTVDYLISSGQWADFEGREDLEITEEVYADLAAKQNQMAAYDIVNELIDSTGAYGKAIISHIKNGGNPDEIIDIFKAQKEVEQFDGADDTSKESLIERYYKDVAKWKPEKVARHIKRLTEDNELETEFDEVKELYDSFHKEKIAQIEQRTEEKKKEDLKKREIFTNNIKGVIDQNPDLTPQEKSKIASSILDFKHKLENGQKVNDFYLKFAEVQKDPVSYVELVRFIMDMDGYKNKIKAKEETAAAKKTFSFVKGNKAVKKPTELTTNQNDRTREKSYSGTNFSFALNKR